MMNIGTLCVHLLAENCRPATPRGAVSFSGAWGRSRGDRCTSHHEIWPFVRRRLTRVGTREPGLPFRSARAPLEAAMTEIQERRAEGAGRVRVETLVEVCGNEPGIPAFEAEAVDVSARGMHLRTAYLPDNGAPLVCRFEEGGREIVVEGRVAWRREGSRGGEFGVEFTALDSG